MAPRRPRSQSSSAAPVRAAAPVPGAAPADPNASFAELGVPAELCDVLTRSGITSPFPIQTATLPDSLAGRDVLGRGRTGSGKTLAFALPVLTRLAAQRRDRKPGRPRALILAPTRELATQIDDTIRPLAKPLGLRTLTVFGGVGQNPQVTALRNGIDIVVACPGRLEDLIGQGHCHLDRVEVTVLDEADHMADLGFLPVVKRLLDRTPDAGQRMLFSATLDNGIDVIVKRYLTSPVTHSVDSAESPVDTMTHHVLHVSTADRLPVLVDLTSAPGRTMVFTRTKHRAKQLTKQLNAHGVPAVEMHGNLAQNARTRNLAAFHEGRATAMVATDIAARGIHVDDVTLVIHADPPVEHKAYLHRSGRTARAGADGTVVTLATETQHGDVRQLTRKAGINPTVTSARPGHPLLVELAPGQRSVRSAAEIAAALAHANPAAGNPGGRPGSRRRGSSTTTRVTATGEAAGARSGRRGRSGGPNGGGRGQGPSGGRGKGSASGGGRGSAAGRRSGGGGGRSAGSSGGSRRG
ncbi:DEAD/DEAH box helicase [Rhabdothermincola salaria]|uniref:DEAD/DEAH box helicase n=1 Tax=Rhabdothermincola salaria TaxID=2903142 RepID=UPI001E3D0F40|nr:DEAD/DEAH box helicase [Rhabdothermincola salaria]MCD9624371.1 DEAD/DEAH box helicase [Rhabdothermincola salaria]